MKHKLFKFSNTLLQNTFFMFSSSPSSPDPTASFLTPNSLTPKKGSSMPHRLIHPCLWLVSMYKSKRTQHKLVTVQTLSLLPSLIPFPDSTQF